MKRPAYRISLILPLAAASLFLATGCSFAFNNDLYALITKNARTLPAPTVTLSSVPVRPYYLTTDTVPSVSLSCAVPEAEIRYSVNSTTVFQTYTGTPLTVSYDPAVDAATSRIIRAYATDPEYNDSPIALSPNFQFIPTGCIATCAGNGVPDYYGDGSTVFAAYSAYSAPAGIALDSAGNLYIADTGNSVIRRVDTNGYTHLVSDGGLEPLSAPTALFVDEATNTLYIADTGNHCIKSLDISDLTSVPAPVVVAGTSVNSGFSDGTSATTATLNSPRGILVDGNDLYIADTGNHCVRLVDLSLPTPTISTIAGTPGTAGFSGDGADATLAKLDSPVGLAINNSSKTLYIADSGNHCIRAIDLTLTTPTISTIAGTPQTPGDPGNYTGTTLASAAAFNNPTGLAFNSSSHTLYVADTGNHRVHAINIPQPPLTATVTTIAGADQTLDGDGNVVNYSWNGYLPTLAVLNGPLAVAFDTDIYIADTGNNRIRKICNYTP